MYNKSVEELFDLLESGEVEEEMLIKEIASEAAYKIIELRIYNCLKNNNRYGVLNADKSKLFELLSKEQKDELTDIEIEAACKISEKVSTGELTPMMLPEDDRCYTHFYYYLTRELCKSDPQKVKQLAYGVYNDILSNSKYIEKDALLEKYKNLFTEE